MCCGKLATNNSLSGFPSAEHYWPGKPKAMDKSNYPEILPDLLWKGKGSLQNPDSSYEMKCIIYCRNNKQCKVKRGLTYQLKSEHFLGVNIMPCDAIKIVQSNKIKGRSLSNKQVTITNKQTVFWFGNPCPVTVMTCSWHLYMVQGVFLVHFSWHRL